MSKSEAANADKMVYSVDDVFPIRSIATLNYQKRPATETELRRLLSSPGVVILTGRSGIGKSSLTRYVTSQGNRRVFITQVDEDINFNALAQRALAGLISKLALFDPLREFYFLLKVREAFGIAWDDDTTSTDRLRNWLWARGMLWIVERTERMNEECQQGLVRFLNDLHDHRDDHKGAFRKWRKNLADPAVVCLSLTMHSSPVNSNQEDRFRRIEVGPMSSLEVRQVVSDGLRKLRIKEGAECGAEVHKVSRGVPLAISKLLNQLLRGMGIEETVNQPDVHIGRNDVRSIASELGKDLRNRGGLVMWIPLFANRNAVSYLVLKAIVGVGHSGRLEDVVEHGNFAQETDVSEVFRVMMESSNEQGYHGFEVSGSGYDFRKPFLFEALEAEVE